LVREAWRHPIAQKIETCPGYGPIRTAQLMAVVVTPHRFRTKPQFWAYCGLAIVTRSSSDWVRDKSGRGWIRSNIQTTRGLNRNHNHARKRVVKGAATTVIAQGTTPLSQDYARLVANGTKPNLAKLTLARRIAAIVLAIWKTNEEYNPTKHRKQSAQLVCETGLVLRLHTVADDAVPNDEQGSRGSIHQHPGPRRI